MDTTVLPKLERTKCEFVIPQQLDIAGVREDSQVYVQKEELYQNVNVEENQHQIQQIFRQKNDMFKVRILKTYLRILDEAIDGSIHE